MKLSFMTLGCPEWDLATICARGQEYGYDGVDFRGYLDQINITTLEMFTSQVTETRQTLADAGLAVSGISTSIRICDPENLDHNLEEAARTIEVAKGLGAPNIRVFGGGDLSNYSREELAGYGCDCMSQILEFEGARKLNWLFETHDLWVQAEHCRLLLDKIPGPSFGALWDMGHTWRVGREKPEASIAALGGRIGYVHVKDAVFNPASLLAMDDGWHYVTPGKGELPLKESISLLQRNGYDGWLLFEHEKRWHPNLAEPEEIFPDFVKWITPLIQN